MKERIVSCLLCLALLLGLSACGDKTPQDVPTAAPQTTAAATGGPTALESYEAVARSLAEAENLKVHIRELTTITTAGEEFESDCTYEAAFSGIGTENFLGQVEQSMRYCGEKFRYTEQYADGNGYLTLGEGLYSQPMTGEEFLDRFYPLVLVDGTLYEQVESTVSGAQAIYTFTGPTEPEPWLAGFRLSDVEATAAEEDGQIVGYTYRATCAAGGAVRELELTVTIDYFDPMPAAPESENFTEIENLDAPLYLKLGILGLDAADSRCVRIENQLVSYASSELVVASASHDIYGTGRNLVYKGEYDIAPHNLLGIPKNGYHCEELIMDGKGTFTEDGEEPTTYIAASSDVVQSAIAARTALFMVDPTLLSAASMEVTGAGILIRFTGNEACGEVMEQAVEDEFFGNPTVLMELADSYTTETLEGYLALDLYTLLPTAYSVDFTGIHTFDGEDCPLVLQHTMSLDLPSQDSYFNVTDEHLPEQEPENPATPVFYKVTDDQGNTLWLLGTIHVGDSRTGFLPREIYDAFDSADALAVEFDSDAFLEELENDPELQEQIGAAYMYEDGSTIQDHLQDQELYELALTAMQISGNYAFYVDNMKPFFWSNAIENFYLRQGRSLSGEFGMDNRLLERARDQEKRILDVESGQAQLQMLSDYSDTVQEYMLASAVAGGVDAYQQGVSELYEMWCRGDEAELIAYLNEEEDTSEMTEEELAAYEEYNQAMLTDRNVDMLKVAQGYLESGDTVFYAVGLAHLLGQDGLVDALRQAGYTVELVAYTAG